MIHQSTLPRNRVETGSKKADRSFPRIGKKFSKTVENAVFMHRPTKDSLRLLCASIKKNLRAYLRPADSNPTEPK